MKTIKKKNQYLILTERRRNIRVLSTDYTYIITIDVCIIDNNFCGQHTTVYYNIGNHVFGEWFRGRPTACAAKSMCEALLNCTTLPNGVGGGVDATVSTPRWRRDAVERWRLHTTTITILLLLRAQMANARFAAFSHIILVVLIL